MLLLLSDYILDDEAEYICRKEQVVPVKFVPSQYNQNTTKTGGATAILPPITVCNQNLIAEINKEELADFKKEE